MRYTSTVCDYAELLFTKNFNPGSINVSVDGLKIDTNNTNSTSIQWQQTYTSLALSAGNHTVRLVQDGSDTSIDVDVITSRP